MSRPDSRNDILGRVRARLGRTADSSSAVQADIEAVLQARAWSPRCALPTEKSTLAGRFVEKSRAHSSTVEQVATLGEVPAAVVRYLREHNLPLQAVIWPQLAGLDWSGAGLSAEARGARDGDRVGITGCFCALAETGTLMLCGSRDTPATVSLLPETHIALVPSGRIVPGMEEAWALARDELGTLPRAVNFISGPSRTGDIEQTIVLGAHGPYRVHLVLIETD